MKCKTIKEVGDSKVFDEKVTAFLTELMEKNCQIKGLEFSHSPDYFCVSIVYAEPINQS